VDKGAVEFLGSERDARAKLVRILDLWDEVDRELFEFMTSRGADVIHSKRSLVVAVLRFAVRIGWDMERAIKGPKAIASDIPTVLESNIEEAFYQLYYRGEESWKPENPLAELGKIEGEPYDVFRFFVARDAFTAVSDWFASTNFGDHLEGANWSEDLIQRHLRDECEARLAFLTFAIMAGHQI
jgi:hypothetical protein